MRAPPHFVLALALAEKKEFLVVAVPAATSAHMSPTNGFECVAVKLPAYSSTAFFPTLLACKLGHNTQEKRAYYNTKLIYIAVFCLDL